MSANNHDPIPVAPVPPGCQPAPGYILQLDGDNLWLTQDGGITDQWEQRGVWATPEAAQAALDLFTKD